MIKIAIAGGIGSGKSIVSRILRIMQYPVYDSDLEARRLMEESCEIITSLKSHYGSTIFDAGRLNRRMLADIVFSSHEELQWLNNLVHDAVKIDILKWFDIHENKCDIAFIETAILKTSGLDKLVDQVWWLESPLEVRESNLLKYRAFDSKDIKQRMSAQNTETASQDYRTIINDGLTPVLPRIEELIRITLE